ncbi:MAG: 1-acyl-sn-glycerol-3-phosphate acyltransferase [SAR202 cluster bacterium]|nr:1-acyl-sn-glycerol-3-phosphate acyltransferase [SAR202 cluster bacterium]
MKSLNPTCNFLQRITLRIFADYRVEGKENVPPMGPIIIVANHCSNFDPPLLSTSLPRRVRFLAKREMFKNPFFRWFFTSYGAHPVNREGLDITAYKWMLEQLSKDAALVIFPEGTRSRGGGMKRALPGVTQVAIKSQATILPVAITGTEKLGSWLRVFNPTGKIRVKIGQPFTLPIIEGKPDRVVLDSMTDMIMGRIAMMLPESYQGVYKQGAKASQAQAKADAPKQ